MADKSIDCALGAQGVAEPLSLARDGKGGSRHSSYKLKPVHLMLASCATDECEIRPDNVLIFGFPYVKRLFLFVCKEQFVLHVLNITLLF